MSDGPGLATNHVPDGVAAYKKLRDAGFEEPDLKSWAATQTNALRVAGFKPSEIEAYWGDGDPQDPRLSAWLNGNIAANGEHIAQNPSDAFKAGWQMSDVGLIARGDKPDTVMGQGGILKQGPESGLGYQLSGMAGQIVGDLPFSIGGFLLGAPAGARVGAVAGPEGAGVGAALTGGAAASAAPEAVRQVLLDAYEFKDGNVRTWQDAARLAAESLKKVGTAGTIGAVSGGMGEGAGVLATRAGATPAVAGAANVGVMVASAGTTGAALEGRMPNKEDFEGAAAMALIFHAGSAARKALGPKAAARVQHNLETAYRETGLTPKETVDLSRADPALRDELFAQDVNGQPVTPFLRQHAPNEPEPFKPESREVAKVPLEGEVLPPAPKTSVIAATPTEAKVLLGKLEGSKDDSVSPAGAIGKFQIMPGTARQYMGKDFDVKTLHDPKVNEHVADIIIADLHRRYNGDMTAIAIAYNAGPGRAGQYLTKGPGTRLKATPDKKVRGGIRYEEEPSTRDESFLPLETQRYLANGRRRSGGEMGGGDGGGKALVIPSFDIAKADGPGGGGKPPGDGGSAGGLGDPGDGGGGFWASASEETLSGEMLSNIGEAPRGPSLLSLDRIMGQYISELTPARNIDKRLIEAGDHDAKSLGAEDMFRQTYASDMRAGVFVRYGAIDAITLDIKKGSASVLDAVKATKDDGGNFDGWIAYMMAKRTVDKAAQGVDTGINPRAAEALAANKKAAKKYDRATKLFNSVMDSVLDYSKDSGVHSHEQVQAMIRDNPTYLSFRRIMGDDESFAASGRGFTARDALKRMEGSDRQIVDPVRATIDNMRVIVKMADRNRAIGHVIGYAERGQFSGLTKLEWNPKATIAEAGSDVFKPYGIDPMTGNETYGPLLAERAQKGLADNEFLYFRNGVPEKWRAESPELAALLRKADTQGQANIIMETASFFAKVQRAGITLPLDFATRNVLRDQISAFVLDPTHPLPFTTWLEGVMHVIGGTDAYKDTIAKGGLGAALASMDADYLARDMHAIMGQTGVFEGVANAVKHPIEFAQLINEKLDAASRVGYKLQAERKGYDPIKAATMSRKAYLDFAERGTSNIVNGMSRITPFFRPALLGMKQLGEALGERPVATVTYATVAVTVPAVAMFMLNWLADQELPDGEKYTDIPQWQRDMYFITPPIGGTRLKLRYPANVGVGFGALPTRVLERMANDNPRAFKELTHSFLNEYMPPLVPAIVEPPVEHITNYSFFSGRPLIPNSLEGASGYMQYTPATSEVAKKLSRILGPAGADVADFSPIVLDNYVKGWTGTIGTQMLRALDVPFHAAKKPYELADLPFVQSFVVRHPGMSSQSISDFYDEMHRLETYSKDFSLAMKRAEGGDVGDVAPTAAASEYANAVAPIKDAISTMSTIIQGIQSNDKMSDVEKRQAIDAMMPQIIGTAQAGLKTIEALPKRDMHPQEPEALPAPVQVGPAVTPASVPAPAVNQGLVPVA